MSKVLLPASENFSKVVSIIENVRGRVLKVVNTELLNMY